MRIAFNPSTVAALTTAPNNKDITFDLRGRNIFARGVKFCGTDTNTWRDIKINNVSIGSHTLDLRNGSNTTLTNTNGVVTINSTWRPVADNLTSDSATSSLSANQGRVLAGLINGKSDSDHNHDGRYLKLTGGTLTGNLVGTSAIFSGRFYGNRDDEGIIIKPASNGYAGLILGTHDGERSIFYFIKNKPFWRYSHGSDNLDIIHPKKSGTIALISDIPNKNSWNYDDRYLKLTGGTMSGQISSNYSVGTWIAGCTNAILKATADGYNSLICAPIKSGNVCISAWTAEDNLNFGYAKKGKTENNFNTRMYWDAPNNNLHAAAFTGHLYGTADNAVNSDTTDGVHLERSGELGVNDYTWLAGWTNDGKKIKAVNKNQFATSGHTHDGRYVYNYGGTAANGQTLNQNALFMSTTSGITGDWWHILQAAWNGEYRWNSQIAFPTQNRNGMYYRSGLGDNTAWGSWIKLLDANNYSGVLDSRYYTESEVNSLLDAKLNRQNLSYGTWNPRGYSLAADYNYNGGDLSISESGGQIHVSVDGYFWQNEGQYRVLDTSDVAGLKNNLTVHQYLSNTDTTWQPLIWGGSSHKNTSDSTGAVYKSYNVLSWQTSSQTLYATNIRTENIKHLSIGGGIFWNPYVESATDSSDAASITLVKSGVAGGTTLVLSQMDDANDTIQFKTNAAARLYHNSYPILTTQNTYVNNHKGYIYGAEITQVNNSDTVDGWHKDEINRTLFITSGISGLSSYWAKLWEINLNNQYNDVTITFLAAASYYPSYFSIFSVYLRQTGSGTSKGINARLVELIGNIAVGDTELRLYVNNTTGNCQLWGNVKNQYGTMNLSVLKKAWRTDTDSSNIGTFFSTSFSSVQSLPGDGWYKVGVIQQGVVGAFNPASHTHTWTSITDKIVARNEFNVVNAGFKEDLWFNYLPINDRSKSATISAYCFGNGNRGYTAVRASGFIKNGGNENQLLRADGGIAAFNWSGQAGQPTWLWGGNDFNSYYVYNPSNFRVAYAASAGNAETLGGFPKNYGQAPFGTIPCIGNDGVMEIGKYIDFHNDNSGKYGFSTRLQTTDNYGNSVNLPSNSGTLALTSDILNYYWANVKISASSSTTTSPTVHTLTATRVYAGIYSGGQMYADNSIRMSSIRLERTNEINSSDNLHINYRSSTNVNLCQGGGNVGIGTLTPTQKLDVSGNIITKGFGIQPYYLSKSVLPTVSPGDGYTYKCLEIDGTTEISCIIADRAGFMNERGILIKFSKGYDGQIILLKDLQTYGSGYGYFWVMPSGCKIIRADGGNILIDQNQISRTYDDGHSRFLVYSSVYSVWLEFLCS